MKILQSKLSVPETLPYLIDRPRLVDKVLDRPEARLFVFEAPAGFGKTTLAQQILNKLPRIYRAWIHLDIFDKEPRRFIRYLLESLAGAIPSLKQSGIIAAMESIETPLVDISDDLCFFFQEYSGCDCWLVLDNYESIAGCTEIKEIIEQLIMNAGDKLKIIINSRVNTSLPVSKLTESGRALKLSQSEMAFDLQEISNAVHSRSGISVPDDELEEIWKVTSGWCVNIGLILENLRGSGKHSFDIPNLLKNSEALYDYINQEMLQRLSPDFRLFLARCSVLDVLSDETCRWVIDDDSAIKENLRALRDSSIPFSILSHQQDYRLHPIIKDAANNILRKELSLKEQRKIYHAAVEYYRENDQVLEAIKLLVQLPDYPAALEAIDKNWFKIVELNGQELVRQWLDQFPDKMRRHHIFIKTIATLYSLRSDHKRLAEYLSARLNITNFKGHMAVYGSLWMQYQWAKGHVSDKAQYESIKKQWNLLNTRHGPFSDLIIAGVELVMSFAASCELRIDQAILHANNCLDYIGDTSFDYRMTVLNNLAVYEHTCGKSDSALRKYKEYLTECEERKAFAVIHLLLINIVEVYLSTGRYRQAIDALDTCLEKAREYGLKNIGIKTLGDQHRGIALWYIGERKTGLRFIRQALRDAPQYNWRDLATTELLLEYFSGLDNSSGNEFRSSFKPRLKAPSPPLLHYLFKEAWSASQKLKWDDVYKLTIDLKRISQKTNLVPWQISASFMLAYWAGKVGETQKCRSFLKDGLQQLKAINWLTYPMSNNRLTAFIIARAIRYNIYPDVVVTLLNSEIPIDLNNAFREELKAESCRTIERERLFNAAIAMNIRGLTDIAETQISGKRDKSDKAAKKYLDRSVKMELPPPVIKTMGQFQVTINGKTVSFTRKKSKSIFQLLLIEYPGPVHEEVIIERFWPESEPAKGKINLRTAITDLRRDLDPHYRPRQKSYIGYDNEHYFLDLPEVAPVDLIQLKELFKVIDSSVVTGTFANRVNDGIIRKILSLHQGQFLPDDIYQDFTIEEREVLLKKCQDVAVLYAQYLIDRKDYAEAVEVLESFLKYDSLWRDGIEFKMRAQASAGHHFRALRTFRQYEANLRKELDLPPDDDLIRLFESLSTISLKS